MGVAPFGVTPVFQFFPSTYWCWLTESAQPRNWPCQPQCRRLTLPPSPMSNAAAVVGRLTPWPIQGTVGRLDHWLRSLVLADYQTLSSGLCLPGSELRVPIWEPPLQIHPQGEVNPPPSHCQSYGRLGQTERVTTEERNTRTYPHWRMRRPWWQWRPSVSEMSAEVSEN